MKNVFEKGYIFFNWLKCFKPTYQTLFRVHSTRLQRVDRDRGT